jgi:hypothetical protein
MLNRYNISLNYKLKSYKMTLGQKEDYRVKQQWKSEHEWSLHRCNWRRGRPSFLLLHPTGSLDFDSNI